MTGAIAAAGAIVGIVLTIMTVVTFLSGDPSMLADRIAVGVVASALGIPAALAAVLLFFAR